MARVNLDDMEVDFDSAVKKLYDECAAEVEGMSEDEKFEHFFGRKIEHLVKMYELDAPQFLIDMAHEGLQRHLNELRDRCRAKRDESQQHPSQK